MSYQSYAMLSVVTNSNNESKPIVASSSQLYDPNYDQPMDHHGGVCVKVEDGTPFMTPSHAFDSLSIAPAENHTPSYPVESSPLIETSRPYRLSTLQPVTFPTSLVSSSTLTSNFKHPPNQYTSGNVVPHHQLSSSSYDNSAVTISQNGHSSPTSINSSPAPSQHVSINSISNRPRTSHPVFHTTSALAAHHGIPQSLPPVPRTTRYRSTSDSPPTEFDFSNLCSNYLSMLNQKSEDNTQSQNMAAVNNTPSNVSVSATPADDAMAVQALMEVIQGDLYCPAHVKDESLMINDSFRVTGSPEFDFLTSPMEDSPFEDFLSTPAVGPNDDLVSQYLTSPAIADVDDFGAMNDYSLFDMDTSVFGSVKEASTSSVAQPPAFNFDGLLAMPSPVTPSLDPTSLQSSPLASTVPPPPALDNAASRRKSAPNGTRKNITPESLVPYDAPIQPRKYVTPSATSRKEMPAVFQRKRARSQAFEEEEEVPTNQELDAIEAKRRQNTLAARRSRKRKLEYQRELEDNIDRERGEKEYWRMRVLALEATLQSHGIEVPPPPPS